jgi:hypothetical protein
MVAIVGEDRDRDSDGDLQRRRLAIAGRVEESGRESDGRPECILTRAPGKETRTCRIGSLSNSP